MKIGANMDGVRGTVRCDHRRAVALLVLLTGCLRCEPEVILPPPPDPKHDLVIERGKVRYNGVALAFKAPVDAWHRVLGLPSHCSNTSNSGFHLGWTVKSYPQVGDDCSAQIYDDLGVVLRTRSPEDPSGEAIHPALRSELAPERIIYGLAVHFVAPTEADDYPHKPFPGRVVLESAWIHSKAELHEVNNSFRPRCKTDGIRQPFFTSNDMPWERSGRYECKPEGIDASYVLDIESLTWGSRLWRLDVLSQ